MFKNVDAHRSKNNITYANQTLGEAYEKCFGAAVKRYNEKQNRADRRINDYYVNLFGNARQTSVAVSANKQKSFYETLVQVGTKDDAGIGTDDGILAARCLDRYMRGFQERNPNFYVFNAVMHMDEATPHLHIDYIPIGHYNRGLDTQNGIAQALKEMGYGSGKDAVNRWRLAERKILENICQQYGIEISEPQKSRGTRTVELYKKEKDEAKAELKELRDNINTLQGKKEHLKKQTKVLSGKLRTKQEIDNLPVQITKPIFGDKEKVVMAKSDYDSLIKTALSSPAIEAERKLEKAAKTITELEIKTKKVSLLEKTVKDLEKENRQKDIQLQQLIKKPSIKDALKRQYTDWFEKQPENIQKKIFNDNQTKNKDKFKDKGQEL